MSYIARKGALALGSVALSVAGTVVTRKIEERRIEKLVRRAIEKERLRERGALAEKPTFYERYGKRACDIAISTAALPVVGVVCAACGTAIIREDGGPVFYNAPRVGLGGREFTMFKLRSMKVDAPDLVMEDGSTYNGADDPRMTNIGAFMRRASLDEIPQFLNVLRGDMSVVGPRHDLTRETELYEGDEALKLTVKPGVTGYAAVYGRNSLPWHDRLALDVEYVRKRSFPLDVKIFLKTFATVFKQEGIYVE
ncbi:MAG: sugar transferase [Eggerthellaceae bacterium]|nr:sugar transferase [Eggerthellaceae bacterium]